MYKISNKTKIGIVISFFVVLALFLTITFSKRRDIYISYESSCDICENKCNSILHELNRDFALASSGKRNGFQDILLSIGIKLYPEHITQTCRFEKMCHILDIEIPGTPPYPFVQLYYPFFLETPHSNEGETQANDFKNVLLTEKRWSIKSHPSLETWISANSEFLNELRTIVPCEYFAVPIVDTGFCEATISEYFAIEYNLISSLCLALKCRALYYAGNLEWQESINDIIAGIHLAWHLMQADQIQMVYPVEYPVDFTNLAIGLVREKKISKELLKALLDTLEERPPRMPNEKYYYISQLFALDMLWRMEKWPKTIPELSPGMLFVNPTYVTSRTRDMLRYQKMSFDWNIVMNEVKNGIINLEKITTDLSVDSNLQQNVIMQDNYLAKYNEAEIQARQNSHNYNFNERSKFLGKIIFNMISDVTPTKLFFERCIKWTLLKTVVSLEIYYLEKGYYPNEIEWRSSMVQYLSNGKEYTLEVKCPELSLFLSVDAPPVQRLAVPVQPMTDDPKTGEQTAKPEKK